MPRALLRNGRAMHLDGMAAGAPVDVGIDADGRVRSHRETGAIYGTNLYGAHPAPEITGGGAWHGRTLTEG